MTRLAFVLAAVLGLYAAPACAADTPSADPEPITVAAPPPDNGMPPTQASPAAVPIAESNAAPTNTPTSRQGASPDARRSGIGLKIEPFGWLITLISR